MKDYREYKQLYKYIGFFTLTLGVLVLTWKLTNWVLWLHQCINASL